jgi:hypothetical protein
MRDKGYRTLFAALALVLVGSASALAAGPLHGKTYRGYAPSSGTSSEEHHHVNLHAGGEITLQVSRGGSSVLVGFTSPYPLLYCYTSQRLKVQSTRSTSVSGSGTFRASIAQRFKLGPGPSPITQLIVGHFYGHKVYGTIYTNAGECSGVSTFSASA